MVLSKRPKLVILGLVPLLGAVSVVVGVWLLPGEGVVAAALLGATGLAAGALAHRRGAAWEAPAWGVGAIAIAVFLLVMTFILAWILGPTPDTPCGNGRVYC